MKSNYSDSRGTITDLIVTPDYSVTHITFKKGAVRGNHYHRKTIQIDFLLKGRLLRNYDGSERFMEAGQSEELKPNIPHAYMALRDSEMLSVCFGVRRGSDYEKDVIRLKKPLL